MKLTTFFHKEKKDVALVLSSGGARGLAHIGAIDELLKRGYHITSVAGTSMGALVAGMYASGHFDEFKEWMAQVDRKKMHSLTDFSIGLDHIVKGDRIIEAIKRVVPDVRIEDLPIPFGRLLPIGIRARRWCLTMGAFTKPYVVLSLCRLISARFAEEKSF